MQPDKKHCNFDPGRPRVGFFDLEKNDCTFESDYMIPLIAKETLECVLSEVHWITIFSNLGMIKFRMSMAQSHKSINPYQK